MKRFYLRGYTALNYAAGEQIVMAMDDRISASAKWQGVWDVPGVQWLAPPKVVQWSITSDPAKRSWMLKAHWCPLGVKISPTVLIPQERYRSVAQITEKYCMILAMIERFQNTHHGAVNPQSGQRAHADLDCIEELTKECRKRKNLLIYQY